MRDRTVLLTAVGIFFVFIPVSVILGGHRPPVHAGARLHIDVKGPDGKVIKWAIEAGAPNGLLRRGFNKNSLPVGTEVVVEGWQAKDGSYRANGSNITFPDGKKLFLGSSGTGAPYDPEKK